MQDSLRLRILAPPAAVAGEPLPVTLRVENASGRTLELHLRGRTIAFDLIARSAAGDTVWRRLDGAVIPAILRLQPLAADGVLELEERWLARDAAGEPLPAGDYTITGELLTDGEPLRSPPAPLRITDG